MGVHVFTLELVPEAEAPPPRPRPARAAGLKDPGGTVEMEVPRRIVAQRRGDETVPGVVEEPVEAPGASTSEGALPAAASPASARNLVLVGVGGVALLVIAGLLFATLGGTG